MFLPVITIRELGYWSWLIFALPNCVGGAAMAYRLKRENASFALVANHLVACRVFSIVTICFQAFFLGWLSDLLSLPWTAFIIAAVMGLYLAGTRTKPQALYGALAVYVLSLFVFAAILWVAPPAALGIEPRDLLVLSHPQVIYLIPVCFFGFLLCPYLDLTFHRCRQAQGASNARLSFSLGFGIFFLSMIVVTFFYALPMAKIMQGEAFVLKGGGVLGTRYLHFVALHIALQAGYTIAIHTRVVSTTPITTGSRLRVLIMFAAVSCFLIGRGLNFEVLIGGIHQRECLYRLFMSFYGLYAPAYVWLCVIPRKGKSLEEEKMDKGKWIVWLVAVALVTPLYAAAFLGSRAGSLGWFAPAVTLLLLARLMHARSAENL